MSYDNKSPDIWTIRQQQLLFRLLLYCLILGLLWIEILTKNTRKIARGACLIVTVSKGVLIGGIMRLNGQSGLGPTYRIAGTRRRSRGRLAYWRIYDLIDTFRKAFHVIASIKRSWWVLVYSGHLLGISRRFGHIPRIKMATWKTRHFGLARIEIIDSWKVRRIQMISIHSKANSVIVVIGILRIERIRTVIIPRVKSISAKSAYSVWRIPRIVVVVLGATIIEGCCLLL